MQKFLFCFCLSFLFGAELFAQPDYQNQGPKLDKSKAFVSYLIPGVGYSFYQPRDHKNLGVFHGVNAEFVIVNQLSEKDKGPANWRLYARMSILNNLDTDKRVDGGLFFYGIGGTFSFEPRLQRNWMIPYFGIELGGINQQQVGGSFQATPTLGFHVFNNSFVTFSLFGGYTFAARHYDVLSGWNAAATLNISFW